MLITPTQNEGFSLVELLVVVSLVFILSAVAIIQVGTSRDAFVVQNLANEFKSNLERARFDSIKRSVSDKSEMAHIVINSADSYTTKTDLNLDGKLDSSEVRNVDFRRMNRLEGFGRNLIYPISIYFNNKGQAEAFDGIGKKFDPWFTICDRECSKDVAEADNNRIINISSAGTVTILSTTESLKPVNLPEIEVLSTSKGVDSGVSVGS